MRTPPQQTRVSMCVSRWLLTMVNVYSLRTSSNHHFIFHGAIWSKKNYWFSSSQTVSFQFGRSVLWPFFKTHRALFFIQKHPEASADFFDPKWWPSVDIVDVGPADQACICRPQKLSGCWLSHLPYMWWLYGLIWCNSSHWWSYLAT